MRYLSILSNLNDKINIVKVLSAISNTKIAQE